MRTRSPEPALILFLSVALAAEVLGGCSAQPEAKVPPQSEAKASSLKLAAAAFKSGGSIPRKFSCEGADISPELTWTGPAAGTQSFALIVDDPDAPAGTWVHWVVYDLPATARHLPEGVPQGDDVAGGGRQGLDDFGKSGYGGPCPPSGKPHRYFFKLYALDKTLGLDAGASKSAVEQAMQGHILTQAELVGRYGR